MNPYPYLQHKFWDKRAEFIITSVQADIYYCLLMLFNKAFWPKKFTRTNESMANLIGISKNTFKKGRTKLGEIGLIQYYGENPTTYILPDLEIFRSSLSKKEVSKIDTQTDREIDTCNDERSESGSGARSVMVSKIDTIIRHKTNTKTNTVNNKDSSKKKVSFPPTERDGLPMIEVKENVFMTEKEIEIVKKEFGQDGYDWIIKKIAYQQEQILQGKTKRKEPYTHILKVIENWAAESYQEYSIKQKELAQREERLNNQNNKSYGTGKNNQNNKLTADDIQTAYNGVDDICGVV